MLGRLLLQKGLKDFGFDSEKIEEIRFNQFEKPLLEGLSFSISHSKNMVVCALSQSARLGVDIEVDGKVKLNDLKSFFTDKEWSDITSAKNQRRRLFQYWTRKESILKAIGTGLAKLEDIHLLDEKRGFHKIRSDIWHFYELDLGKTCITTLCVDTHPIELKINPFSVGDSLI